MSLSESALHCTPIPNGASVGFRFFFRGKGDRAVSWFPVSRAAFPAREKAGTARTKSLLSKSRGSSTSFDDADRWKRTALKRPRGLRESEKLFGSREKGSLSFVVSR